MIDSAHPQPEPEGAMQAIERAVQTTLEGWSITLAYGGDVFSWLASERIAGNAVLIVHTGDDPDGRQYETGAFADFVENYQLYMRTKATPQQMTDIRRQYKALRKKLNGLPYTEDGEQRFITIGSGSMDYAAGVATPQLALRAQ